MRSVALGGMLFSLAVDAFATDSNLVPNQSQKRTTTVTATAYCPCAKCCGEWHDGVTRSGVTAVAGFTLAGDPEVFPIGTRLEVPGFGEMMVQDIGSGVKGLHIDVFFDTHAEALRFGRKVLEVVVVHRGGE